MKLRDPGCTQGEKAAPRPPFCCDEEGLPRPGFAHRAECGAIFVWGGSREGLQWFLSRIVTFVRARLLLLWRRYGWSHGLTLARFRDHADDLESEVLMTVLRYWNEKPDPGLESSGALRRTYTGFLYSVCRSRTIDLMRKLVREERRREQNEREQSADDGRDAAGERVDSRDAFDTLVQELLEFAQTLDEGDRRIFLGIYLEGRTARSLGEELVLTGHAVRGRAIRRRDEFRKSRGCDAPPTTDHA